MLRNWGARTDPVGGPGGLLEPAELAHPDRPQPSQEQDRLPGQLEAFSRKKAPSKTYYVVLIIYAKQQLSYLHCDLSWKWFFSINMKFNQSYAAQEVLLASPLPLSICMKYYVVTYAI